MIRIMILVSLIVLVFSTLSAQTATPLKAKSPSRATFYSFAGTIVPAALSIPFLGSDAPSTNANEIVVGALLVSGILIGPGLGHLYSSNTSKFARGIAWRAVAGGVMLWGALEIDIFDDSNGAATAFLLGGVVVLVSAVADIATADGSARKYNRKHRLTSIKVVPRLALADKSVGLVVSCSF